MRCVDRAQGNALRRVVDDLLEEYLDLGRQLALGAFRYIGIDMRVRDQLVQQDLEQYAPDEADRYGDYPALVLAGQSRDGRFDHTPHGDGEHDAGAQAQHDSAELAGEISSRGVDDGRAHERSCQRNEHAEQRLGIGQSVRTVEVRDERAQTDKDEYRSAHDLRPRPVAASEDTADLDAGRRYQEGNDADHAYGKKDVYDTVCLEDLDGDRDKGNSYGERIDAGGDRHHEHCFDVEPGGGFLVRGESLLDHVAADDRQEHESYPGCYHGNETLKYRPYEVTDKRHRALEESEPRTAYEELFGGYLLGGQTFADGYGKGIHCKTD